MRFVLLLLIIVLASFPTDGIPFAVRALPAQGRRMVHTADMAVDMSDGSTSTTTPTSTTLSKKKKVLILMSDTGGGHRASAQALDQALNETFPGKIDVDIVDIWTDHATWPFNGFVPAYKFLATYPNLWRLSYFYARFPPTRIMTEAISDLTSRGRFREAIEESQPDMVVSVHPLCQHIPVPIVSAMNAERAVKTPSKLPISFVTVVTDLGGAHETWFDKKVDFCFVPSAAVERIAKKNGLTDGQIIKHGLPVRPPFWRRAAPKDKLRSKLELKNMRKTVLLMGGGDGVGGLKEIATQVATRLGDFREASQMVVICGNNKRVAEQLRKRQWPKSVNVAVCGFCDNVDEYMGAADCLVTKAGPGTIAEAMTRGLPIVLSSFLPGQERGNVPYVTKGGFGVYSGNNPAKIADHVLDLFSDDRKMKAFASNSLAASSPSATSNIARDIGRIVLRKDLDMPALESEYPK